MSPPAGTLRAVRIALAKGKVRPAELAREALNRASAGANKNTYLWRDPAWTMADAARAEEMPRGQGGAFGDGRDALWGVPVSVKDCFDLAGSPTSCGTKLYRDLNGVAARDSWLVEKLRSAGAVIIGKTHLHPLAYGITGENPDFADCVQPGDPGALTGGSSSGAAVSILEGSAIAAIGTDTGGSVRAPASLCGLAGYRASISRGNWRGGTHLAQSFDTFGWLFRDLEDAPLLASVFTPENPAPQSTIKRFAIIEEAFLHDCEPGIVASMHEVANELEALGLEKSTFSADWWAVSYEIFAPLQAWEAAQLHSEHFDQIQPDICQRLEFGAKHSDAQVRVLRDLHKAFRNRLDEVLSDHQMLLLPAIPVSRLAAGADHSKTRSRLLRYTTPFSLGGVPVVTIPGRVGGMQLAAARDNDEALVQVAAALGARRNSTGTTAA